MTPLYTQIEFEQTKHRDFLPLQCKQCSSTFYLTKNKIHGALNPNEHRTGDFCSRRCGTVYRYRGAISSSCKQCGTTYSRKKSQMQGKNIFCSKSCSSTYSNQHRTHGTCRSKVEHWLEEQLTQLYPDLDIDYNNTGVIGKELDIYIPSLKKAIEINGIFHYEPIFGEDKWKRTQENDKKKVQTCIENDIDLMVIDITTMNDFKPAKAQVFLDQICAFISQ